MFSNCFYQRRRARSRDFAKYSRGLVVLRIINHDVMTQDIFGGNRGTWVEEGEGKILSEILSTPVCIVLVSTAETPTVFMRSVVINSKVWYNEMRVVRTSQLKSSRYVRIRKIVLARYLSTLKFAALWLIKMERRFVLKLNLCMKK